MIERLECFAMSATLVLGIGLAAPALATEAPSTPPCVSETESESLDALRPTLLILANDYDRKAAAYASEAERFRAWASAEELFTSGPSGKRSSARAFQSHATELDHAAAESRRLAAQYRRLVYSHARSQGC